MQASQSIKKFLRGQEALRLTAYPDPGSRDGTPWTIGWGATSYEDGSPVRKGDTITAERADALFEHHVGLTEKALAKYVTAPLSQNQYDALVSFVYNVGAGAFANSTMLKKLNAGDYAGATAEFDRWVHNDGKVLGGLVDRRKREQALFASGVAPAAPTVAANTASKPMSPFILPALTVLVDLIPTLSKLFKGSKPSVVAERNVAAVEAVADKVLPIILEATGASNVQAAVEVVQSDPVMVRRVDQAVRENYFEVQEVYERRIAEARKFAMEYQSVDYRVRTVIGKFTFVEVLSLLFLLWGMAGSGIILWGGAEKYGAEMVGLIVGGMLVIGVAAVREFWLGSSNESQRKTDYIMNKEAQ